MNCTVMKTEVDGLTVASAEVVEQLESQLLRPQAVLQLAKSL